MSDEKENINIADLINSMQTESDNDEYIPSTDIELTHKIVETLFDNNNINMVSSVTKKELSGILKLFVLNEIVHEGRQSIISRLINNFLTLKVSENRLGRSELIKAIIGRQTDIQERSGFINKYIRG